VRANPFSGLHGLGLANGEFRGCRCDAQGYGSAVPAARMELSGGGSRNPSRTVPIRYSAERICSRRKSFVLDVFDALDTAACAHQFMTDVADLRLDIRGRARLYLGRASKYITRLQARAGRFLVPVSLQLVRQLDSRHQRSGSQCAIEYEPLDPPARGSACAAAAG